MIDINGITFTSGIENCRNVYLYEENQKWVLSTRAQIIGVFDSRDEGVAWWERFEELRGFSPKPVKNSKPVPKSKITSKGRIKFPPNTRPTGIVRCSVCSFPAIPGDNVCAMHAKQ